MRLGTRITLVTSLLVAIALGFYGVLSVRIRAAELTLNLEAQTHSVGATLQVALEAAQQEGLFDAAPEDVRRLMARLQAAEPSTHIAYIELQAPTVSAAAPTARDGGTVSATAPLDGGAPIAVAAGDDTGATDEEPELVPPPVDPTRAERLRRIQIDALPYGEHIQQGGAPVYAYAVPLRDQQKRVVAAIDLTRDETEAHAALASTIRTVTLTVLGSGLVLALLVWLTTRRALSHPLQRLVEGIDEVTVGDLTRVILRERDDEIGDLADRFNQMTTSLREARAQNVRGVEARLSLEARLRQSEKLATVGQLAASIAHEVGTPLNVIGGRARSMEKKSDNPAEVSKNAGIIAVQAARITKIIQQLLDYARKKPAVRTAVDVGQVVRDTLDFLSHQLMTSRVSADVRAFEVEPLDTVGDLEDAPRTPHVVGDADQLQQVFINLCMNAIQASPSGGTLTVSSTGVVRRKPGLESAPPSRWVVVEVSDTGSGISPEMREHLFEPFTTTKQDSGGTGLGLTVSSGIVKDHDGWIEVEANRGGGTRFIVYLPAVESAVAPTI